MASKGDCRGEEAKPEYNDILDRECVRQCDVSSRGVVISVPTVYVASSENGVSAQHPDRTTDNLRVLPIERLDELMRLGIEIPVASHDRLVELWNELVSRLIAYNRECAGENGDSSNEREIIKFLDFASRVSRDMNVADEHVDSTANTAITFDVIREYTMNEHTTLLIDATAKPWVDSTSGESYAFYSLLPTELWERVRRERNDTDLMRYHYCLQRFERTLRFEPGHIYDRTVRLANLTLFYLCLVSASWPIEYLSSNDLKAGLLGYMIDIVVRSRVIGAWQRDPAGCAMLSDLTRNYEDTQIMVQLCRLTSSRERAKFMLGKFASVERVREAVRSISYDSYAELLESKAAREIDGVRYYAFDSAFLAATASLQGFGALRSMYESTACDEEATTVGGEGS